MKIRSAEFVLSANKTEQLPNNNFPEYCFAGRSNVGKSSLINLLLDRKSLAKSSNTPGKTQSMNSFLINKNWYLLDLPGYGFAKVSKDTRKFWKSTINEYLINRNQLWCVFALIDSRHLFLENDLHFIETLLKGHIPFALVFTKTDKLKTVELKETKVKINKHLSTLVTSPPPIFFTSNKNDEGKISLLDFIESMNSKF